MRKKLEITERELGKFVGYLRRGNGRILPLNLT